MTDTRKVILLRGVNVGGVKVLMAPLRATCASLGWTDVQTYIASGNIICRADGDANDLAIALETAMKRDIGRSPKVLVMSASDYKAAESAHPFDPEKGNQSHIYFCWNSPRLDQALVETLLAPEEKIQISGGHVHVLAPNGIGRSHLIAKLDQVVLGTDTTGRNLNTVRKLRILLGD